MSSRSVSSHWRTQSGSIFLILLAWSLPLKAQEDLSDKVSTEVRRIFTERQNAVVQVEAYDSHGKIAGTGFFADPSGTIYTLASIVLNANAIFVVSGDKKLPAKLLMADPRSGVALIKVDGFSPFLPLGDSHKLQYDSPIMTIGYSASLGETPSLGIVGGFDSKFLGRYLMTKHIRATVAVQPGFGGAPLMNLQGEVVGIIITELDGGPCIAIPIEAAEKIRTDYNRFGGARYGWVGVNVEQQSDAVDGSHVRVIELGPDTPAAVSGLKDGDTLLQVGSVKISEPEDVIDAAYFLTAGDEVQVLVVRNGQKITFNVRSVEKPGDTGVGDSPNNIDNQLRVNPADTNVEMLQFRSN